MTESNKRWSFSRRAGRACLNCRARKVKCNVEEQGPPCSNCLTDSVSCHVQKSRRGRRPQKIKSTSNVLATPEIQRPFGESADNVTTVVDSGCRIPDRRHTDQWLTEFGASHEYNAERTFNQHPSSRPQTIMPSLTASKSFELLHNMHHELTYASLIDCVSMANDASSALDTSSSETMTSISTVANYDRFPGFVKPLSPRLTSDDINYLFRKGALEIPRMESVDAIIQSYFQYFHWFMPLLDPQVLLNCTCGHWRPGMPRISILVLQAVIFIGATFVDIQYLQKAGFKARRAARKVFYERVRLLYELDVEESRIAVIQATLLLSFWNETPGDSKGGWHFLGIAISLALTIGLHRKQTFSNPSLEKHLLKRIWWSCYMRDRMLALGMSRPLRIKDSDFNTPLLALDDFELENSAGGDLRHHLIEPQCQRSLAEMCITMAQLCVQIGVVIDLHYSILPSDDFDQSTEDPTGRTTAILYPKSEPGKLELVKACNQSLQRWLNNRPASAIFQPPKSKDFVGFSTVVMAHQAFLHVCFCGALSALHRPQVCLGKPDAGSMNVREDVREQSRLRVEEATSEMAKINYHIHKFHLSSSLPPTAATLELPILITHIKHIQYQEGQSLEICLESIFYCLKVLEEMQDLYVGVDLVIRFAADLMRRASINVLTGQNMRVSGVSYKGFQYQLRKARSDEAEAKWETGNINSHHPIQTDSSLPTPYSPRDGPCRTRTPSSGEQANDTMFDLSKVHWGCCDGIFLAENPDLEAMFQLMVDFDSLDDLAS
ncbi:uncharacterized protein PV07_12098 [Cladophialophora immunda]|uniref:Zn(2)-C6 fungal-type domain-containing protein n=1 Tax=Cladophialophora immunda TaxID=569365 RepID=A0A0D2ABN8_9EURO|nr:uncharacterized protein PV07_12098 [Cladophialophora immunda]KIW22187.1 hypothetical protein PV07_12098 [Cladophialophora immunda]OQU99889.1 Fungal Zn2-Cys6 binuclear cluster domain-containing protein [Cladophialophora immunda]